MLKVATLASGSSGNCLIVTDGTVHILIDAGVSARRITTGLKELGVNPAKVAAVLITHEHSDHISGLAVLSRQVKAALYTAEPTARQITYRTAGLDDRFQVFQPGERFAVGELVVGTFATSHDCACPVGYTISDGRCKMALCTDLGVVTQEVLDGVCGAGLLVGEFNYDPDMLQNGSYPPKLKERILSRKGHLSNEMGGKLAAWAAQNGTRQVVLAHLSKENNTPSLALAAAESAMEEAGIQVGKAVTLTVAPRSEGSGWLEVPKC
jgi:phosphoribosyl 1,2-cyclic phosphodiesterase